MRTLFTKLSFAVLAIAVLACALPQAAQAYWHSGVYFGVGAPGYWGPPPPTVVYAAPPPVVYEQAPVVVQQPAPPPNQVSMQCASGPTVTVTGYHPTKVLLRQAAAQCAHRDASTQPPPPPTVSWNENHDAENTEQGVAVPRPVVEPPQKLVNSPQPSDDDAPQPAE